MENIKQNIKQNIKKKVTQKHMEYSTPCIKLSEKTTQSEQDKVYKYMNFFMKSAILSAEMSFCQRKKVGAVITRDNRIVVNSWNGTVSGEDNCCEEEHDSESLDEIAHVDNPEKFCEENGLILQSYKEFSTNLYEVIYKRPKLRTKKSVVHAEANAIAYAAKNGIKLKHATIYVTLSPCINCANLIIQAGISKVVFKEQYRDTSGIDHLMSHNIEVIKIN